MKYFSGLNRSPPDAHASFFALSVPSEELPTIPSTFGRYDLIPQNGWGMLGNDMAGNCPFAGADHCLMFWNKMAGRDELRFTTRDALDDYGLCSGYVLGNPATDNGTDIITAARYWQTIGMRDWTDKRYKIAAYLSIQGSDIGAPDLNHVYLSAYLFGAAGIGIKLPESVIPQFEAGETWTVVPDAKDKGQFHYVPVVARGPLGLGVVSWGQFCWMSEEFFKANCEEAMAYLRDMNDPNANLFAEVA